MMSSKYDPFNNRCVVQTILDATLDQQQTSKVFLLVFFLPSLSLISHGHLKNRPYFALATDTDVVLVPGLGYQVHTKPAESSRGGNIIS